MSRFVLLRVFDFRVALLCLCAGACSETGVEGGNGGSGASAGANGGGGSGRAAAGNAGTAPSAGASGSTRGGAGGVPPSAGAGAGATTPGSGGAVSGSGGRAGAGGAGGSNAAAGSLAAGGSQSNGASGEGGATSEPPRGGAGGDQGTGLESFELVVIGSSTSAGEGASSSSRGWVSLLAASLEDTVATSFSARNLSVGGHSTSSLLPGSSSAGNIDDAIELEPNLVIVALAGSNDLSNGVSEATFLSRLETLRAAAMDAGIPLFFVGTAPKDLSNEEQQALRDWTDAMRERLVTCWTPRDPDYGPCFIDVFDALADASLGIAGEYGAGDGIHLNDAGHARIFELAEPIVRAYVCSLTACN